MHKFDLSGVVTRIEMWPPSFAGGAPSVAQSDFVGYFCGIENKSLPLNRRGVSSGATDP